MPDTQIVNKIIQDFQDRGLYPEISSKKYKWGATKCENKLWFRFKTNKTITPKLCALSEKDWYKINLYKDLIISRLIELGQVQCESSLDFIEIEEQSKANVEKQSGPRKYKPRSQTKW